MAAGHDSTISLREGAGQASAQAASHAALDRRMRRRGAPSRFWWLVPTLYIIFLMLPIYWLVNMSFKTNAEIVSTMTLWPHTPTLQHYRRIFTDESWYSGYINSLEDRKSVV